MFSKLLKISGWYRILTVFPIVWVTLALAGIKPWYGRGHWDEFLIGGILPVIIVWGIIWIVQGFRKSKTAAVSPNLADRSRSRLIFANISKRSDTVINFFNPVKCLPDIQKSYNFLLAFPVIIGSFILLYHDIGLDNSTIAFMCLLCLYVWIYNDIKNGSSD